MTPDGCATDRLDRAVAALPCHEPRPIAAERLRARCHSRLASRHLARPSLASGLTNRGRLLAGTALASAVGLFYLAVVVRRALWLWGF
jgi:hypothetical protein